MMDQLVQGDEALKSYLEKSKTIESLVKLPGDASSRRYYRLTSGGKSYIITRMEPFTNEGLQLPFLILQKHLFVNGIDVPQIIDVDAERGLIVQEDLGDTMLLRRLQEVSTPEVERGWYERVIDALIEMQIEASPGEAAPPLEAFKLRFDHAKLMWEVNFTIEHFYKTYLDRKLSDRDLATLTGRFSEICQTLADQPTVFTHRDFHSRNVMIAPPAPGKKEERLVMIDFQDARMGPAQYDLASLLKDSYYQLDELQVDRLLDYYVVRTEALTGKRIDRGEFTYIFDLMAVQRNFKAIGSFASFLNRRGNPGYLKYIGNTFENIRRTLLKYPEYSDLREVLFHYYYF